jgi:NAD-dependent malate dehydrogenase
MVNVAVIGAAGGIGQPLALLLKTQLPYGSILSLYDVVGAPGVAADLSHIDSNVTIRVGSGSLPPVPNCPELQKLAKGVDVFVIVAGKSQKPGMSRDDLFTVNAVVLLEIILTCGRVSPKACFCIVTNPVNSLVPIAAEALKKLGVYDKNRLFGVSTLDQMRATQFVNAVRAPYSVTSVPVVGGHSDVTIDPLFSQLQGPPLPDEVSRALSHRVRLASEEVINAKAGRGSATLSMATAGARMALDVVAGLTGTGNPVVYSYVDTDGTQPNTFFAIPMILGLNGIQQRLPIGPMNTMEAKQLEVAKAAIQKNIEDGESFARSKL